MPKRIIVLTILLFVLFALPFVAVGQSFELKLKGNDNAKISCDGNKMTLARQSPTQITVDCKSRSSTPVPPTPVPPTPVPPTPVPPTPVPPTPVPSTPSSGIPLCPDHDPTKWHALFDAERNCHYDHEHHDDPRLVDDIFGPVGAYYGGQEISYPWQTFSNQGLENDVKHQGYKWLVRRDILTNNPKPHGGNNPLAQCNNDWCISDFRLQLHAFLAPLDAVVRHHSFWLEARICRANMSDCGIVRSGGWLDFGNLAVNGKVVSLPNDPPPTDFPGGEVRPGRLHCFTDEVRCRVLNATWYGFHREPPEANAPFYLPIVRQIGIMGEPWSPINPDDPAQVNFFCPDFKCRYNGSALQAHLLVLRVHQEIDPDLDANRDGFADYRGFSNRYGTRVQGCTSPGLDCIPLEISRVPIHVEWQYRDEAHGLGVIEYDTSPPGEWWIRYPN